MSGLRSLGFDRHRGRATGVARARRRAVHTATSSWGVERPQTRAQASRRVISAKEGPADKTFELTIEIIARQQALQRSRIDHDDTDILC